STQIAMRELITEYNIIKNLNNPNIIKTLGTNFDEKDILTRSFEDYYDFMSNTMLLLEKCDANVDDYLKNFKVNTIESINEFFNMVIEMMINFHQAITYMLSKGYVHIDLKGDNVLIKLVLDKTTNKIKPKIMIADLGGVY